ncbi:transcriptional regulator with XRE-family HTH domain [Clostridium acetobutylicum]|uniref:Phage related transcriptional regulator (Xre family) n=1 Tax=Clostridium acetobutylicum (strain ATCC 824 / DSM 792 / JCM 1419 / IAM 19013 / LMG 5710 / NBRC 13948 / NRRL B-527 / VKM B-1787 / 2291 / W) TaxID=272562 RepID=Q97HR1_CLOAB|nr:MULTISPECIES: helix-turn-helix transcriptional regulator [Clostridium]AAK79909.1 Phage related transcriptional regulator (Xre family) [Clostridium acetobutylicum ATCC 824]ADZ21001.1 Phage related transcriptional regulator [Clostridium acetobutylicum EA 2018]AEI32086.1 phage related transcriptional regulator [Clostridium acetobutylicum DSM 1731]AWV79658.1 XRE family transcriptional regulator [Clostridium acetobutylicum]MBC2394367.1 helix-turn-helix transcriptional regulator [Clostridium acet
MLGENLKKLRKEKGLTQRQLAGETGLSVSIISKLEEGKKTGSIETLQTLSNYFNVTVDELSENKSANIDKKEYAVDELLKRLVKKGLIENVEDIDSDLQKLITYTIKETINKIIEEEKIKKEQ